jgi:hypothetical protein
MFNYIHVHIQFIVKYFSHIFEGTRLEHYIINNMLHQTIQSRFLNLARKSAPKYVSADEAVSHIQSNSRLYVHSIAASPNTILNGILDEF